MTAPVGPRGHSGPEALLLVDAANVVGSRPDGWWKDRAGAARRFVAELRAAVRAGALDPPIVVVLEGRARAGADELVCDGVRVVHAAGSGDDTLVALAAAGGGPATLVTADRGLARRASGVDVRRPSWLLSQLRPAAQ